MFAASWIQWFCDLWPEDTFLSFEFNVMGLLAIILVALVCGAVGSLVVGNRMAFFSDALAHAAFAGVGLAILISLCTNFLGQRPEGVRPWILLIMLVFGVAVGLGIAWVQEKTSLASDTVIGVFFAGSIGFGAMFMQAVKGRGGFQLEDFLFGHPTTATPTDLLFLFLLLLAVIAFLVLFYNSLVFTTFNTSLARSRRIRIRFCRYLFIVFLAMIVNLSLFIVGALLINALLIVPAATAANLSKNMRQMFWWSIILCLVVGVGGQVLSWEISIADPAGGRERIQFGIGGTIVVLSVILFALSMVFGPRWRNRAVVAAK
jgi:zinc transport system permease protein